jgi:hypothetical protein
MLGRYIQGTQKTAVKLSVRITDLVPTVKRYPAISPLDLFRLVGGPVIDVIAADDVIFAEVGAGLHLDNF